MTDGARSVGSEGPTGNGAAPHPDGLPAPRAKRNRGWIGFFAVLAVLSAVAIALNWTFNARQQLTAERLATARARWKEKGPHDYDMAWNKLVTAPEQIEAAVRGGKVVKATLDGRELEPRLYHYYSMEGLFDFIEQFLEKDARPNSPRSFTVANFDPADGHITRYVRSVSATRERVEITVQLRPAPSAGGKAP